MALADCRECSEQVSTEAESCPHCGSPSPAHRPCQHCGELLAETTAAICPSCGEDDPVVELSAAAQAFLQQSDRDSSSKRSGLRLTGDRFVVENPSNGYRKTVSNAQAKTLFTGSLYFLWHGMWGRAIAGAVAGLLTFGLAWLYLAWKAPEMIESHYLERGWRRVTG